MNTWLGLFVRTLAERFIEIDDRLTSSSVDAGATDDEGLKPARSPQTSAAMATRRATAGLRRDCPRISGGRSGRGDAHRPSVSYKDIHPGTTSCIVRVARLGGTTGVRVRHAQCWSVTTRGGMRVRLAWVACWASDSWLGVRRPPRWWVDGGPSDDGGAFDAAPPATARLRGALSDAAPPDGALPDPPTRRPGQPLRGTQNSANTFPGQRALRKCAGQPRHRWSGRLRLLRQHDLRVQQTHLSGVGCGVVASCRSCPPPARSAASMPTCTSRASARGRAGHARLLPGGAVDLRHHRRAHRHRPAAAGSAYLPSTKQAKSCSRGKANQNVFDSRSTSSATGRSRARSTPAAFCAGKDDHTVYFTAASIAVRSFGTWRGGAPHRRQPRRQRHRGNGATSPSIHRRPDVVLKVGLSYTTSRARART